MRITLQQLRKDAPPLDGMELIALEGGRYLAHLHGRRQRYLLSDPDGRTVIFRSSREAMDRLDGLVPEAVVVVHYSAYGEMIGLDGRAIEPLRIARRGQR